MNATGCIRVETASNLRQCANCGAVGREDVEVSTQYHWIGGRGHELVTYCRDTIRCWARREARSEASWNS